MRTLAPATMALILMLCFSTVMLAAPADGGRLEEVLSWDDGTYSDSLDVVTASPGCRVAVMFQAPEWATCVTGVHYYIMDDGMQNPNGPDLPSTSAFLAYVWRPEVGVHTHPGEAAMVGMDSGELYPEDEWLELTLPQPVSIEDSELFPDGVFFVGLEWLYRRNPHIGYDDTEPIEGFGWLYDWVSWAPVTDVDVMIRAVISDGAASPVSENTWAVIKACYR